MLVDLRQAFCTILKLNANINTKLGIRSAYEFYESKYTDEFVSHFLNKDMPQFWKVWNKNFERMFQNKLLLMGIVTMLTLQMFLLTILKRYILLIWLTMIYLI